MNQPLTDLLLEVASGVLVCVGEEVQDTVTDAVVLEVVHHVGAVALGGWDGGGGLQASMGSWSAQCVCTVHMYPLRMPCFESCHSV